MTNPLVIRSWQQAGTQLGLTYDAGPPQSLEGVALTGVIDGFPTTVIQRFYRYPAQELYTGTSTLFKVELDELRVGPGFVLWPSRSRLRRIELFNRRDVFVGDRKWDYAFVVRSSDPDAARRFLTPQRRIALAAASPRRFKWTLQGSELIHHRNRLVIDEKLLVTRVQRLIDIARAIRITDEQPARPGDAFASSRLYRDTPSAHRD